MGFKNGVVPPLLRTRECKKAFKEIALYDFSFVTFFPTIETQFEDADICNNSVYFL